MTKINHFSEELLTYQAYFATCPLQFVLNAFEWGKGDLVRHDGAAAWQVDILRRLEEGTLTMNQAVRVAVASGHGIGKSALVAWIILWAICTMEDYAAWSLPTLKTSSAPKLGPSSPNGTASVSSAISSL